MGRILLAKVAKALERFWVLAMAIREHLDAVNIQVQEKYANTIKHKKTFELRNR